DPDSPEPEPTFW
ncbi:hypothetical protein BN1723_019940, partial [Verticillium longisporum]